MDRKLLESLNKSDLIDIILKQAEVIDKLTKRVSELEAALVRLEAANKELADKAYRSAAPFGRDKSKRKSADDRKKPGRKPGHKPNYREPITDDKVDEHLEAKLEECPACGQDLAARQAVFKPLVQTLIELPEIKPMIIRLTTYEGVCPGCSTTIASSHPLQVSHARGAAATHLGARALGFAAELNKGLGLSMRKTTRLMSELLGIALSPGGLSQAMDRLANKLKPDYHRLEKDLKAQPVLYTDETGWYVGERGHSLWVMTNKMGSLFKVVASKTKQQARDLLGGYQGILVSDCLNLYDDLTNHQHKCYAHHLKAISQALDRLEGQGSPYLNELKLLLKSAMGAKPVMAELPQQQAMAMRQSLVASAERLLLPSRLPVAGVSSDQQRIEEGVRQRLFKQRDHLFVFLDHPDCDATNNHAERALRHGVITRKISCGNKTENGAHTWEVLTSLSATSRNRGQCFVEKIGLTLQQHILTTI